MVAVAVTMFCPDCQHELGRHDPDYGSCDRCSCVNLSLIEKPERERMNDADRDLLSIAIGIPGVFRRR